MRWIVLGLILVSGCVATGAPPSLTPWSSEWTTALGYSGRDVDGIPDEDRKLLDALVARPDTYVSVHALATLMLGNEPTLVIVSSKDNCWSFWPYCPTLIVEGFSRRTGVRTFESLVPHRTRGPALGGADIALATSAGPIIRTRYRWIFVDPPLRGEVSYALRRDGIELIGATGPAGDLALRVIQGVRGSRDPR